MSTRDRYRAAIRRVDAARDRKRERRLRARVPGHNPDMHVDVVAEDFRTRVRFPPPPPLADHRQRKSAGTAWNADLRSAPRPAGPRNRAASRGDGARQRGRRPSDRHRCAKRSERAYLRGRKGAGTSDVRQACRSPSPTSDPDQIARLLRRAALWQRPFPRGHNLLPVAFPDLTSDPRRPEHRGCGRPVSVGHDLRGTPLDILPETGVAWTHD